MDCHSAGDDPPRPLRNDEDNQVRVALIGSPNAGKTTIFNALTGLRAKTANYPGVTVTRRVGTVTVDGRPILLEDLPGTYSLSAISPDERVVTDLLSGQHPDMPPPDALIIVADVTTLSRSLILVAQAMRLGLPSALVLTMLDEFEAGGGSLDFLRLSRALGIEVVPVVGVKGIGMNTVRALLAEPEAWPRPVLAPPEDPEDLAAWIDSVLTDVIHQSARRNPWTQRIDRLLLHPVTGSIVFVLVMIVFFQVIFTWATPLSDGIDTAVTWAGDQVSSLIPWPALAGLIGDGIIGGVGAVLVFVPQIVLLFVMISFLENVGYMARAALVMDRVMGAVGLEGRSFVALLSSYACAVPGIMATRTIPSSRNRIATIMVAPLMTCSARLPVYTLFIAAFVPNSVVWGPLRLQGLVMLGLYVLGAVFAMLIAFVLKHTRLKDDGVPFYLELPPYRLPSIRHVFIQAWDSAKYFLRKAGTIILGTTVILWVLLNIPYTTVDNAGVSAETYRMEHSIAADIGQAMEPVFEPLGFTWEINVALLSSLAAREVFVSTLGQISAAESDSESSTIEALQASTNPDGTAVYTPAVVAAILLFFVFALQCMSTVAVMRRETNSWRWPLFAFTYLFVLAYSAAWIGHQIFAGQG